MSITQKHFNVLALQLAGIVVADASTRTLAGSDLTAVNAARRLLAEPIVEEPVRRVPRSGLLGETCSKSIPKAGAEYGHIYTRGRCEWCNATHPFGAADVMPGDW
jgi:hypothetical protein